MKTYILVETTEAFFEFEQDDRTHISVTDANHLRVEQDGITVGLFTSGSWLNALKDVDEEALEHNKNAY